MTSGFTSWVLQFLGGAAAGDDTPWSEPTVDDAAVESAAERLPSVPAEDLPVAIRVERPRDLIGSRPERTSAMMSEIMGTGICTPRH